MNNTQLDGLIETAEAAVIVLDSGEITEDQLLLLANNFLALYTRYIDISGQRAVPKCSKIH